ncbi:ribonucleoside-diphosphate reductase subunit alpha [Verrucomicrobia bacterium LW23]|nr:ribonucleoside-diphosphate reductase subunit alpha [Verrucomicrobia bacterium LW23]
MLSDAPQGQLELLGLDPLQGRPFLVRKRDGTVEDWNDQRVLLAIEAAFRAEFHVAPTSPLNEEHAFAAQKVAEAVRRPLEARAARGEELEVENIQDTVEAQLMALGHFAVGRRYIVYREERRRARALRDAEEVLHVTLPDGRKEVLIPQKVRDRVTRACHGLEADCDASEIADEALRTLYDGVKLEEIDQALILASRSRIEREPAYTYVTSRLLLDVVYREVLPSQYHSSLPVEQIDALHRIHFRKALEHGSKVGRVDPELLKYDLDKISSALVRERDEQFNYLGLQTIYDRYLLHHRDRRFEAPQYFWMRVAMGLAIHEKTEGGITREDRAIEFYEMLSTFRFTSSTPTLFNAGTPHPQLSSCYLSTVMDDLDHIFKVISDDAKLSKWAGGLGNDWTNIRATGAHIRGTNGRSQGVIPFLKVANDTAVAVNQGGKRKGAMCAYLETWHLDVEDFLELRKNTGDERRRTHDMNTANWIPDLFMKRVSRNEHWTLFNPSDTPDLHDLYGKAFEARYMQYEADFDAGKLKLGKRVEASSLWRKMLTLLFETGHPWLTFKDPSNVRSPQDHTGVVHSSNLCTEILLNTSEQETAVCNLGSVNLVMHINEARTGLDAKKIAATVRTAMRMLDNVIDINFYPTPEAKTANLRHRPVGLGIMGFQDVLYALRIPYASQAAVEFADKSMELISYNAILSSTLLAKERGAYSTFPGSKWSRGLLPIDTVQLLEEERGGYCTVDRSMALDWTPVRESLAKHGMRNSNTMAIAPTATISNITGVSQSIEPTYKNLYAKSNLSGEFISLNPWLVEDLKEHGLWDEFMLDDLKYYDGSLKEIERIPEELKERYRTAFEIEPKWLIDCASRRQKWIDMGQSLNLYLAEPSGRKLNDMYLLAWERGLKTTYYLRTLAATQIEKSTVDINRRGLQPRWMKSKSASSNITVERKGFVTAEEAKRKDEIALPEGPAGKAAAAALRNGKGNGNGNGHPAGAAAEEEENLVLVANEKAAAAADEEHDPIASPTDIPASQVGKACSILDPGCESCQ